MAKTKYQRKGDNTMTQQDYFMLEIFTREADGRITFKIEDENGVRYCGELFPCQDCNNNDIRGI